MSKLECGIYHSMSSSIEDYRKVYLKNKCEVYQLSEGLFSVNSFICKTENIFISERKYSCAILELGETPKGYSTFIFNQSDRVVILSDRAYYKNHTVYLPENTPYKFYLPEGAKIICVSVCDSDLESFYSPGEIKDYCNCRDILSENCVGNDYAAQAMFELVGSVNCCGVDKSVESVLEYGVSKIILSLTDADDLRSPRVNRRENIVKNALDCIFSNYTPELNAKFISNNIHVNQRSIEQAFSIVLKQNPQKLINKIRLNRVRGSLLCSRNSQTIQEICSRNGITHMGNFGRSYKKLFKELPSKTLRRAGR